MINKKLAGRWFDGGACNAKKMETPLSEAQCLNRNGMFYVLCRSMSLSAQCPDKWKHNFLKRNGERRKTQRAMPQKKERQLCEAQWYGLLCRTTEDSACNAQTKWKHNFLKRDGVLFEHDRRRGMLRSKTPQQEDKSFVSWP